jgi:hypothetical protein
MSNQMDLSCTPAPAAASPRPLRVKTWVGAERAAAGDSHDGQRPKEGGRITRGPAHCGQEMSKPNLPYGSGTSS